MFSPETLQKFAREVTKYPAIQKQSAVMACLAHAQEEKGWLTPEAIESVANYLDMPPMAAFEVASLKEGECMGACGDAPVLIVNNRTMCSHMHPEQIDKLLEECK